MLRLAFLHLVFPPTAHLHRRHQRRCRLLEPKFANIYAPQSYNTVSEVDSERKKYYDSIRCLVSSRPVVVYSEKHGAETRPVENQERTRNRVELFVLLLQHSENVWPRGRARWMANDITESVYTYMSMRIDTPQMSKKKNTCEE
ncbi:hypothetical protein C8J57DRAFT_1236955 [Mycena rebaudengoi]|nr:hypothetical protein C8J57DRAFT_1236955 [Mycena rebaudengoi]